MIHYPATTPVVSTTCRSDLVALSRDMTYGELATYVLEHIRPGERLTISDVATRHNVLLRDAATVITLLLRRKSVRRDGFTRDGRAVVVTRIE